jgi:chaperonin GroES
MSIENSLYAAPVGLDSLGENESAIEIEVVDPEAVTISAGDMEITIVPDGEDDFGKNLAEDMDEGELQKIASDLIEEIDADITSRKDWVEMYVKGLEVLGMKYEERTEPWDGACGVYSTVLTEAAIRFQSETITETFPAQGPVKTKIIGAINKMTEEIAERVREDMNYKLTDEMPEYRPEHERMLYSLGLAGSAFKKVYFDPGLGRQVAMFIPAEDLIIPYGASNVMSSERVTHTMRKTKNEIRKLQVSGFYLDVDLGEPVSIHSDIEKKKAEDQGFSLTDDDRYQVLEIHVDFDLPGYEDPDGIALPYVITIDRASTKVLAIRRNWKNGGNIKLKRNHFVQYTYIPGFGVYGLGLIHIIGGYARAGTSLIRQLVDAGTLSNLPGGLKARGLRIKGDDTPIAPGEFRDVDVASGTVRDNIMPLPYKEPSQVLMGLLSQITEEARRLGSVADMKVSDMSANAPVGTTLAILERQLKTMSAVQARVHFSMKEEFKLLKDIIRDNAPESYDYDPVGGDRKLKQSDYDVVNVIPVSDPNSATMAQRIMQYQAVIQLSQTAPQIYDLPHLHRQMIEVLGIKNADKLIPLDDEQKPKDPVYENMAIINMKPVKAFQYQDHQAHIQVHMSATQDPVIMKMIGQNPQAQAMQAAMMAHIAEHTAFAYRQRIEQELGIPLPPEGEDLPPQVELALSGMMAQAAQQVLQQNQAQAAQQQAQEQQQDPVVQMQQQELAIKNREVELKEKKLAVDAAARADELELKRQAQEDKMELEGFRAGRQSLQADKKLAADQERDGVKIGVDIAKSLQASNAKGK